MESEAQVMGERIDEWFFPSIEISKELGISIKATKPTVTFQRVIGDRIEHELKFSNLTDYEYRRFGFTLQFPEFIEHSPRVKAPPGFDYTLEGENMDWRVFASGGGEVTTPQINR